MIKSAQIFKDLFLDLLFPRFCFGCSTEGSFLCDKCAQNLKTLNHKARPLCVYDYHEKLVQELLYAFKYDQLKSLDQVLSRLMLGFINECRLEFDPDWITSFVPMHPKKQSVRGFNQAELLAKQVAAGLNLEMEPVLFKHRHTRPQMQLNRTERQGNLKNAFSPIGDLRNKKIILIDDVCTTGATFEECRQVLLQAGVRKVFCLAFARDI